MEKIRLFVRIFLCGLFLISFDSVQAADSKIIAAHPTAPVRLEKCPTSPIDKKSKDEISSPTTIEAQENQIIMAHSTTPVDVKKTLMQVQSFPSCHSSSNLEKIGSMKFCSSEELSEVSVVVIFSQKQPSSPRARSCYNDHGTTPVSPRKKSCYGHGTTPVK